jgi:hypothetical protein
MIRDDLTPEQLAAVAAEGTRLAARRSAEPPAQDEQPKVAPKVHEPVKARNMTLIAIHHLEIEGRVIAHGAEIMPGLIAQKTVAKLLDQGRVRETEHRSLYRIFSVFSGCKEREPLTEEEIDAYTLPEL